MLYARSTFYILCHSPNFSRYAKKHRSRIVFRNDFYGWNNDIWITGGGDKNTVIFVVSASTKRGAEERRKTIRDKERIAKKTFQRVWKQLKF